MSLVKTRKPKILSWDIETSYMKVYCFGLWQQNIDISNIVDDWFMICASWKWMGDRKTHAVSVLDDAKRFKKSHKDDYHVVQKMHEVLSEADLLIAHNGDRFDLKKFNTRAIKHGLPPIPPIPTIDTLKVAKRHFGFTSNRLDYIARFLGVGAKLSTAKGMWREATEGGVKAIKNMVKYNKVDVIVLEDVYKKLRPFMRAHPNFNLLVNSEIPVCPKCGSKHLQRRGTRQTNANVFQRFQCKDCNGWSRGKQSLLTQEKRSVIINSI